MKPFQVKGWESEVYLLGRIKDNTVLKSIGDIKDVEGEAKGGRQGQEQMSTTLKLVARY